MKLVSTLLLALSLPVLPLFTTASHAGKASFACTEVEGRLATAVQTKKGNVALIYWDSAAFNSAGFSPQVRCQKVTERFQKLYGSGQLKYLAAGTVSKQPVICGTKSTKAACNSSNMLFTLKPGSDPRTVLKRLNDVRNRAAGSAAVEESGGGNTNNPSTDTVVDMEDWLKYAEN
jgi:Circadian oscillating protein COP23